MKPKNILIILIVAIIIIFLFSRGKSRNTPSTTTPAGEQNENTVAAPTTSAGTEGTGNTDIDNEIQSFDSLINSSNPEDFGSGNLSGIE